MKKATEIVGLLAVLVMMLVGGRGIYSWFTDQSQRNNSFSVGGNEVKIEENFPGEEIIPGKEVEKEVKFTNTGKVPMYVRACYLFSDNEAQDNAEILMGSNLWEAGDDGYYYYQASVQPQESTELFIRGLKWKETKETKDFDLTIYTETVQAAGHKNAREAFSKLMERKEEAHT